MSGEMKMHENEQHIHAALVQRLLAAQFPEWAEFPVRRVESAGTDNALFRLGDDLVVRMPRIDWATGQVEKEWRWLPQLAPHLPVAISVPLAKGKPGEVYPWHWSVNPWLEGENATLERIADPGLLASDLVQFIDALHGIDTAGGPASGADNSSRGVPLAMRDDATRAAIDSLRGTIDTDAATAAWDAALSAPVWDGPPVWIHGDLQSGNLLVVDGRLNAVIDFGCLGVGDPAVDLIVAWNLLDADSSKIFRSELDVDDATWARGRGWALSVSLIALPYYYVTNPTLAGISRYAIEQVLADYARER